jgi:hypothetical protein
MKADEYLENIRQTKGYHELLEQISKQPDR